ncbi:MAG: HEAT repeat domain-containing protein, partial [Gammaproteobacteria bacterium]|nr:HEAT repeat domain-containing protein [Gammaproteobacteria bacterium]
MTEFPLPAAPPHLLDDEAMRRFVREGYFVLKSELPREFHDRMHDALDGLDERGPLGHNNLLPCVPELARLLDEPVVRGAMTSILGPGYYLHFHRHDHFALNNEAQPLHKDGDNHSHNAVDGLRRIHRTRFAMLFYYPQDTPLEKGPTGIVPRSQYVPRRALEAARYRLNEFNNRIRKEIEAEIGESAFSPRGRELWRERRQRFHAENPEAMAELKALDEPWESAKIPLLGDAGTVAIVHFDMVHGRYSANTTDLSRHMVKFLFTRDREPVGPAWNGNAAPWPDEDDPLGPVWQATWDWHRRTASERCKFHLPSAIDALDGVDDHVALGAAYTLGTQAERRKDGLDALFDRFLGDDLGRRVVATYGVVAAGEAGVPRLIEALHAADAELAARIIDVLGDIGPPAASALTELTTATRHQDVNVRRYAVEALGTVA